MCELMLTLRSRYNERVVHALPELVSQQKRDAREHSCIPGIAREHSCIPGMRQSIAAFPVMRDAREHSCIPGMRRLTRRVT